MLTANYQLFKYEGAFMKLYFKVLAVGITLVATHSIANAMFSRTIDPFLKGASRHLRSVRPSLNLFNSEVTRDFHASPRRPFPMGGMLIKSQVLSAIKRSDEVVVVPEEKKEFPLVVKVLIGAPVVEQNDIPVVDEPKDNKSATPKAVFITEGHPVGC
jgi:hypothetical protein